MANTPETLSEKQRAFVRALIEPGEDGKARSIAGAYRDAYAASGMSPKAVRNEASKLKSHPGVSLALERERARLERSRVRNQENTRRGILARLDNIADDQDQTGAVRVQALRLIGIAEVPGMFTESQRVEVGKALPDSESETLSEIEETLREAFGISRGGGTPHE